MHMKREGRRYPPMLTYAETWVFAAAFLFLLLFAFCELQIHAAPRHDPKSALFRVFLLVLISAVFYTGGLLRYQRSGNTRVLKTLMGLFFLFYLYLLVNMTLLDGGLGREYIVESITRNEREEYLRLFVNLRPFRSIYEVYIRGFIKGYVNTYYTLVNLMGNLLVLAPFAFFLPLGWKAQKKWFVFLPTILALAIAVEALQFAFMVGSCDVDDLILNVSDTMLVYLVLKCKPVASLLTRFVGDEPPFPRSQKTI